MANKGKTVPTILNREELEALADELRELSEIEKRQAELDARVLGRLHTNYGHRRPRADDAIMGGAWRRTVDLLRGGG